MYQHMWGGGCSAGAFHTAAQPINEAASAQHLTALSVTSPLHSPLCLAKAPQPCVLCSFKRVVLKQGVGGRGVRFVLLPALPRVLLPRTKSLAFSGSHESQH
eukprot:1261497-Rhodomonas_salina.1